MEAPIIQHDQQPLQSQKKSSKRSEPSIGSKRASKKLKHASAATENGIGAAPEALADVVPAELVEAVTALGQQNAATLRARKFLVPYSQSKNLKHATKEDYANLEPAQGDAEDSPDFRKCCSLRFVPIDVRSIDGSTIKLKAEMDTGADDCLISTSQFSKLDGAVLVDKSLDFNDAGGEVLKLTRSIKLAFKIGTWSYGSEVRFWDMERDLPSGVDVLLSGPFLIHHGCVIINPLLKHLSESNREGFGLEDQLYHDCFFGITSKTSQGTTSMTRYGGK